MQPPWAGAIAEEPARLRHEVTATFYEALAASAANAWDRRRNHSGEGVQGLDRPCRRYWWSEHLLGFEPTTPSSRRGMPIHCSDEGP